MSRKLVVVCGWCLGVVVVVVVVKECVGCDVFGLCVVFGI